MGQIIDTVFSQIPSPVRARLADEQAFEAYLLAGYGAPARHYHGVGHLADLMQRLQASAYSGPFVAEMYAAILFHDLIYDVVRTDNELQSAVAALTDGPRWMDDIDWTVVATAIRATTHHDRLPEEQLEARLLCDLDLLGLLADDATRARDLAAIRQEYDRYSDDEFDHGRVAFFDGMLARERILWTLDDEAEARLRANLVADRATTLARIAARASVVVSVETGRKM